MDSKAFGKRLQKTRKSKGYTGEALSEKAGISVNFLRELERGRRLPSVPVLCKLAEILNTSIDSLLRDSVSSGESYVLNELTIKMRGLPPESLALISAGVEAMVEKAWQQQKEK